MKTARFSTIVQKCGRPTSHLVLTDPKKDRNLQAAVKGHRVMTIAQPAAGHQTDRAAVGFDPGPGKQFLVFPKSLRAYEGVAVVGIKYDLVQEPDIPKGQLAKKVKSPKPKKPKKSKPAGNVIEFPHEKPKEVDESVAVIKRKVRHAMKVLEQGKHVAAFHLLKEIVQ